MLFRNTAAVQFKLLHPKPPESVCSLPCERGQAKKYVEGESCCWHCFNCSTYQVSEANTYCTYVRTCMYMYMFCLFPVHTLTMI